MRIDKKEHYSEDREINLMTIEIDNALISQWEPKIQRLLANTFVRGLDKEDLEQELRIAIIKAAKGFNSDKGVIFHTYLHTSMVNTLRTLISKAQRTIVTMSLDNMLDDEDNGTSKGEFPLSVSKALQVFMEDEHYNLDFSQFTEGEQKFLELRLEGFTMEEISKLLGESSYKLRQAIQQRVSVDEG